MLLSTYACYELNPTNIWHVFRRNRKSDFKPMINRTKKIFFQQNTEHSPICLNRTELKEWKWMLKASTTWKANRTKRADFSRINVMKVATLIRILEPWNCQVKYFLYGVQAHGLSTMATQHKYTILTKYCTFPFRWVFFFFSFSLSTPFIHFNLSVCFSCCSLFFSPRTDTFSYRAPFPFQHIFGNDCLVHLKFKIWIRLRKKKKKWGKNNWTRPLKSIEIYSFLFGKKKKPLIVQLFIHVSFWCFV